MLLNARAKIVINPFDLAVKMCLVREKRREHCMVTGNIIPLLLIPAENCDILSSAVAVTGFPFSSQFFTVELSC